MAEYISKSALVAEIEKRVGFNKALNAYSRADECNAILSFIDTLEVKEVDLEQEVESYWKQCDMTWCRDAYSMTHIRSMLSDIAKHFFKLGMSVSNKAQKENKPKKGL